MEYKYNSVKAAIKLVDGRYKPSSYKDFDPECWNNREFVETVIAKSYKGGYAIEYASDEIKKDKEIVLLALKKNWQAYKLVDPSMLSDKDILMFMALNDHLKYMENVDKQIQIALLKDNPKCLIGLDDDIKNNRELVLETVKQDASVYKFASEYLRNDKELAMLAVQKDCNMFKYVSENLKNDRELALEAVKQDAFLYELTGEDLRNDKELAMLAVQKTHHNRYMLEYVSEDLKNDRELVLEAVKQDASAYRFASKDLRNDRELAMLAVKNNGYMFKYVSEDLKNDRELILEAVKKSASLYTLISEDLRNDKELAMLAVRNNSYVLKYVSEDLQNDKELVMLAVQKNGYMLQYVDEKLRNDRELIIAAMMTESKHMVTFINRIYGSEWRDDSEIEELVEEAKLALAKKNLDHSRELVLKFVESGLTISKFAQEYGIKESQITRCVEVLKDNNDEVYELYKNRADSNSKQFFAIIVRSAENMAKMIREGVPFGDSNRPFDVLDYYDHVNFEYDELFNIVKRSKIISSEDKRTLRTFFAKTKNVRKPLKEKLMLEVKDMKIDENGIMHEILTNEDKKSLFEYLKRNRYPMSEGTYYAAKKRYLNGYLDISEYVNDSSEEKGKAR